jgi:hypothetical protein
MGETITLAPIVTFPMTEAWGSIKAVESITGAVGLEFHGVTGFSLIFENPLAATSFAFCSCVPSPLETHPLTARDTMRDKIKIVKICLAYLIKFLR